MAWFMRFTRFGDVHMVYAQEQKNSCGIASIMMTVFKINKLVPGAHALHTEQEIYRVYGRVANTSYDGSAYTYANYLASSLNRLQVGRWRAENVGTSNVAHSIMNSVGISKPGPVVGYDHGHAPVIALVGWNKGGGHFVVIDSVVSYMGNHYASVCDPWDGNVHVTTIQRGQPFSYTGAPVPWSWDIGGTHHDYTGDTPGAGNGWIVRRTR